MFYKYKLKNEYLNEKRLNMANDDFSKLKIWRDATISYGAGIAGALVVLFSLNNENVIQRSAFWIYFVVIYVVVLLLLFFITKIFRNKK
jgi:hypothetical protein